jgi:hypothetical protein
LERNYQQPFVLRKKIKKIQLDLKLMKMAQPNKQKETKKQDDKKSIVKKETINITVKEELDSEPTLSSNDIKNIKSECECPEIEFEQFTRDLKEHGGFIYIDNRK